MLGVQREALANMLRVYGEERLAERALSVTDDELRRVGELGHFYAFSELAYESGGGSMGGARALSFATSDVLEGSPRDLRWTRSAFEREGGWPEQLTDSERARDHALRIRAAEEQYVAHEGVAGAQ